MFWTGKLWTIHLKKRTQHITWKLATTASATSHIFSWGVDDASISFPTAKARECTRCHVTLASPGLLASPSSTCSSVHSASECSRHSCRKRAWVRLTLFSRDSRATVCSHSFQPLNQLASTPTWSRNIMVCSHREWAGRAGRWWGLLLDGGGDLGKSN